MIILDDLQRQLDELFVKIEWQRKHESLSYDERMEKLISLINTLDDDEAYPYVKLYESYKLFKDLEIDI